MSVSELLSTRRSLGLLGSTRQFVVLSPYPGTDAPAARAGAWTARALRSAFQQLKVAHAVVQAPADEVQRRVWEQGGGVCSQFLGCERGRAGEVLK